MFDSRVSVLTVERWPSIESHLSMGLPIQPLNSANAAGVSLNSGKYFQAGAADSERKRNHCLVDGAV